MRPSRLEQLMNIAIEVGIGVVVGIGLGIVLARKEFSRNEVRFRGPTDLAWMSFFLTLGVMVAIQDFRANLFQLEVPVYLKYIVAAVGASVIFIFCSRPRRGAPSGTSSEQGPAGSDRGRKVD
jgi:hypothetical protein